MKTKEFMYEAYLRKYVWSGQRNIIIVVTIILFVLVGTFWKYDEVFLDYFFFAKLFFISVGLGFFLGLGVSYVHWFDHKDTLVEKAINRNKKKMQRCEREINKIEMSRDQYLVGMLPYKKETQLSKCKERYEQLQVLPKLLTNPYKKN